MRITTLSFLKYTKNRLHLTLIYIDFLIIISLLKQVSKCNTIEVFSLDRLCYKLIIRSELRATEVKFLASNANFAIIRFKYP